MKNPIFTSLLILIQSVGLFAGSSSSSNYEIGSDSVDSGGGQTGSASYSNTSSIGGIAGLSSANSPDTLARSGYAGQLFEIDSVNVSASPGSINEGASSQLSATVLLDDGTFILPPDSIVQWSRESGLVTEPTNTGSVTALPVYQNSVATLGGTFAGVLGTSVLNIIDSNPDNFGSYGTDGIDDDWQVTYFGEPPNANADPSANPDGDSDDNYMEFLTGFNPMDPSEWFQLIITDKSGSIASLQLNKVIPGRTYTIQAGTDLQSFPETITVLNPGALEFDWTVDDSNATEQKKFYRVDVTKP